MSKSLEQRLGLCLAAVAALGIVSLRLSAPEPYLPNPAPEPAALTTAEHTDTDTVQFEAGEEQALYQRILADGIGVMYNRLQLHSDAKTKGYWEPVVEWPLVPIQATLLQDGRVLAFDAAQAGPAVEDNALHNKTRVAIWDPATDTLSRHDADQGYELFCAGFGNLSDGQLFLAGGNRDRSLGGIKRTHTFNPLNDRWSLTSDMAFSRWYGAVTPLSSGEMLITGGGPSTPEVRETNGLIRRLNAASDPIWGNRGQHPWIQAAPNGGAFYLGPQDGMRWIDTAGSGQVVDHGLRGGGARSYGNMVLFDKGKLLVVGGAKKNSALVIDINGATPAVRETNNMHFRRAQHNSTLLADGTVLVTGGNNAGRLVDLHGAVYEPELWNPDDESWTRLAPMAITRQYHSTALLLPDGRVFSAGGGMCGVCQDNNYHMLNSELFLPPYLFDKAGNGELADRPAVISAPVQVGYHQSVELQLETDLPIAKLVFVRPGSSTHAINQEQRAVPAPFEDLGEGRLRWTTPENEHVAPPGNYMLFAVDRDGVPSVARMINVGVQDTRFETLQLANPGFQKTSDQQVIDLPVKGYSSAFLDLHYSATGLPTGVSLNPDSGVISGLSAISGKHKTKVTVRDAADRTATVEFHWEVISAEPAGEPLKSGLQSYWPIYNNRAEDVIGNSHGETLVNSRFAYDAERGNVLTLDEAGDFLRIPKEIDAPSGSFSFWFKSKSSHQSLLSTVGPTSETGLALALDAVGISAQHNGQTIRGGTKSYADNRWHQLTYTYGTQSQRLYVDGELLFSERQNLATQLRSSEIYLGANPSLGSGQLFKGQLDDIRYYDRSLLPSEVYVLFNGEENKAPELAIVEDREHDVGVSVKFVLQARDPEGGALSFKASGLPSGITLDTTTGAISGTLTEAGSFEVQVSTVDSLEQAASQSFTWTVLPVKQLNRAPALEELINRQDDKGDAVSLSLRAEDPDGDDIHFSISGLPLGLTMDEDGHISGVLEESGVFRVAVTVRDTAAKSHSAHFDWVVDDRHSDLSDPVLVSQYPPKAVVAGANTTYAALATSSGPVQYAWSFGDGSGQSRWSNVSTVSHQYSQPGRYQVTQLVRDASGAVKTLQFTQVVHGVLTTKRAFSSTGILLDEARNRVWVANPDNNSVTLISYRLHMVLGEIPVGTQPRSIALSAQGDLWVANKASATLSVIDGDSLALKRTIALPPGSQPHGLLLVPEADSVYVTLEASGQVIRLNAKSGIIVNSAAVAPRVRGLAINADRSKLFVSRYISPPVKGEHTTSVELAQAGGELYVLNASQLSTERVVSLPASFAGNSETSGNGLPNYLGAPVVSPDNTRLWIPSKQDNIALGLMRSGDKLDYQSTVRAVVSPVSLSDWSSAWQQRVDLDNSSLASAAAFGPRGNYLLVTLETSAELAVVDALDNSFVSRVKVGRAPHAVALSADGHHAWVHNFVDRSVSVVDVSGVFNGTKDSPVVLKTISVVSSEKLDAKVLRGKQLFYDGSDTRLAKEGYMSCASCHNDGDTDGRVWDLSQFGEGLRNTTSLRGKGARAHGRLHWTGNFDEVQDFEGQIRALAGGTGLMADDDFARTRDTLGRPKAGLSKDLDALASFLEASTSDLKGPSVTESFSVSAARGRALFEASGCESCHVGLAATDSGSARRHDVGTLRPSSGKRRGEVLDGLDTPTLLGLHETSPYLHNGSAQTIAQAIAAHNTHSLSQAELNDLQSYLLETPHEGKSPRAP